MHVTLPSKISVDDLGELVLEWTAPKNIAHHDRLNLTAGSDELRRAPTFDNTASPALRGRYD